MKNSAITEQDYQVHVYTIPQWDNSTYAKLNQALNKKSEIERWSVDLENWEKVLCVKTNSLTEQDVKSYLMLNGIIAEVMNH